MSRPQTRRRHSARVALFATLIVLAIYVVSVLAINFVVNRRLTDVVDARLAAELTQVTAHPGAHPLSIVVQPSTEGTDSDSDDVPIRLWWVTSEGATIDKSAGAPALPEQRWSTSPTTVEIGGSAFRMLAMAHGTGWIVAGQSIAVITRVQSFLVDPEILVGLLITLVVYLAAFLIGLRATAPLESLRRQQAAFTADASHELRTPLSVIEAEADLALSRERTTDEHVEALRRISSESRRLRSIVDDLLWLARSSEMPDLGASRELVDLSIVACSCVQRFDAVAQAGGVTLELNDDGHHQALVRASLEWIDRLLGVLIDNACKYAGDRGLVRVQIQVKDHQAIVVVEDNGPGIPAEERDLVFDRFRRAATSPGGTGLGLAIADTVVKATRGTWSIGRSELGGARMQVSWHQQAAPTPEANSG
jgi:signal transduction histidine kinase